MERPYPVIQFETIVGEGGMIELEIPSDLAYGDRGRPPVPPKATLHFLVELLKVE